MDNPTVSNVLETIQQLCSDRPSLKNAGAKVFDQDRDDYRRITYIDVEDNELVITVTNS